MSNLLGKTYLVYLGRFFVFLAGSFGTFTTLLVSQFVGYERGFALGLWSGAIFGAIGTICGGLFDYLRKRKLVKTYGDVNHRVRQNRAITVQATYSDAFARSQDVLAGMRAKIEHVDVTHGVITARGRPSLWSFGENIRVHLQGVDERQTCIEIESRPRIAYTLMDHGKNFENVEKFCSLLKG